MAVFRAFITGLRNVAFAVMVCFVSGFVTHVWAGSFVDYPCNVIYNYGACSKAYAAGTSDYAADSTGGAVLLLPTISQVCNNDTNCNTLSDCVGTTGSFVAWRCDLEDSFGVANSCSDNVFDPSPASNNYPFYYSAGASSCKLYYQGTYNQNCGATCTAVIEYPVTYGCGNGSGTAPVATVATYGQQFTFASNTCEAPSNQSFAGWDCTNGVGSRSAGSKITSWNFTTGTQCTAQWVSKSTGFSCNTNGGCNEVTLSALLRNQMQVNGGEIGYFDGRAHIGPDAIVMQMKQNSNAWGVKFDTYGIVSGNAMCADFSGQNISNTMPTSSERSHNCWCNAEYYTPNPIETSSVQYLTSKWFMIADLADPNTCSNQCARNCAEAIAENRQGTRVSLYNEATYCDCPHTVSYLPGEYGTGGGSQTTTLGQSYTIANLSDAGVSAANNSSLNISFKNWDCDNDIGTCNSGDIKDIKKDTICTAQWNVSLVYAVEYLCGIGSGTAPTDNNRYNPNDTVTLQTNTCTAPNGRSFNGWSCNGIAMTGNSFNITENTLCTAQWSSSCGTGYHSSVQILPSNGVSTVVPANMDYTEAGVYVAENSNAYTNHFSYGDITVIGQCGDTVGLYANSDTTPTLSGSSGSCWCRVSEYTNTNNVTYNNLDVSWVNMSTVPCDNTVTCFAVCGRSLLSGATGADYRSALYNVSSCEPDTIKFIWMQGETPVSGPEMCYYGTVGGITNIPQPEQQGYTFAGWITSAWDED